MVIDVETWSSGMPSKRTPHVVDRVDRDADLADLAVRDRVVGVVAHLGRQVEGDRQPGRAGGEQLLVARVGLRGGAEAGVLAHRPRPAGVHRRVDAAGERVLPRLAQPLGGVPAGQRLGAVDGVDGQPGLGAALAHGARLRRALARLAVGLTFPAPTGGRAARRGLRSGRRASLPAAPNRRSTAAPGPGRRPPCPQHRQGRSTAAARACGRGSPTASPASSSSSSCSSTSSTRRWCGSPPGSTTR